MHRRFLILILVCLVVLLPLRVAATALGDMRIFSAPDQALLAEAEIYAPGKYGREDFETEILPAPGRTSGYPYSSLRSDIIQGQGGRLLIRLRGDRPLSGKNLALRLALRMPGQRLIRHYELRQQPPLATATREAARPAAATVTYTVKPGDTLWRLAGKLRPDRSISIPDMVKALYRANPQAFTAGDINRLRLGARLHLAVPQQVSPSVEHAAGLPSGEATASTPAGRPQAPLIRQSASQQGPANRHARDSATVTADRPKTITTSELQRSAAALAEDSRAMRREMQRMNARLRALREHLQRNDTQVRDLSTRLLQKPRTVSAAPAPVAPLIKPVRQPHATSAAVSGTAAGLPWMPSDSLVPASLAVSGLVLLWLMFRVIGRQLAYRRSMRELKSQEAVMLDRVSQKADERLRKEASLRSGGFLPPQSGQVVQLDRFRAAG